MKVNFISSQIDWRHVKHDLYLMGLGWLMCGGLMLLIYHFHRHVEADCKTISALKEERATWVSHQQNATSSLSKTFTKRTSFIQRDQQWTRFLEKWSNASFVHVCLSSFKSKKNTIFYAGNASSKSILDNFSRQFHMADQLISVTLHSLLERRLDLFSFEFSGEFPAHD